MTIEEFIENALKEDIGDGDHTSLACIDKTKRGKAQLLVKQEGIIAGVDVAKTIYQLFDAGLKLDLFIKDGDAIKKGDVVFTIEGNVISILSTERLVLNFMQRMSGIATYTNKIVKLLEGLPVKILDTRKTSPNLRIFEKKAVELGGGFNHRFGLFDMILIKDNHIDFAGGIEQAIEATQLYLKDILKNLPIEIEARSLEDVKEIMRIGKVNRIMLDNFTPEQLKKAITLIDHQYETEASGGITIENIRSYAETGVDFISVGALTHQIKSLDLSLKALK
ncbi:MAG: carboxylating nicotinate-nucleotide diphosphorylase [Bacteroidota bacterium]